MRTNIEIDDELMRSAMEATGLKTKRETVEEGLRALVSWKQSQQRMRALRGKIEWNDDLDAMRRDKPEE
ncbi:type II toxin-antitoxin system VapB family antitoxin [Aureimonas mangrovi]|uniref:type II toxin-antitoxin system VapB family antitoxin n=1 Tax=Aureimonas mangrovi TaxID=2758041 RepID=UPI00163D433E|nr:type II toxin-antitoxin system VapB family antitoxin [Aureimonas mangrovi]